jgi:hypothetical protein
MKVILRSYTIKNRAFGAFGKDRLASTVSFTGSSVVLSRSDNRFGAQIDALKLNSAGKTRDQQQRSTRSF